MKINIKKINLLKNKAFRYTVNVKVISNIGFILFLKLKKGYLKFSFNPMNGICKANTVWMNDNFNMYFTNKEDAAKFIYLMKYLEKNYKKYSGVTAFRQYIKLNSEKVFDKMFNNHLWLVK